MFTDQANIHWFSSYILKSILKKTLYFSNEYSILISHYTFLYFDKVDCYMDNHPLKTPMSIYN